YTAAAFLLWGLLPIFWKAVGHVPAPELLAHRIFWSAVIMALLLYRQRRWGSLRQLLKRRRTVLTLLATTALIGGNWFIYIWAMLSEQILEASLGYFINPLVSVLLGLLVLGERLRPWQVVSIGLATVGVVILTVHAGALPWLGLWLAFSFGLYGLLRKTIAASPEEGLAVETWLLSPFMLG
ncbi:MAG: EamA family transporter RarD, partial [Delftia sp.]|nr:EamA family transporter RarD [Delftia sp.]